MSTPVERLAARWRRTPRAAVPDAARRRAVEHDATHAGGGYLLPERLYSPIPDNLAGVVADESVAVSIAGLPPIANQQQLNEYVLSLLSGASFDVDSILTSGGEVLVNADGNVLVSG